MIEMQLIITYLFYQFYQYTKSFFSNLFKYIFNLLYQFINYKFSKSQFENFSLFIEKKYLYSYFYSISYILEQNFS